MATPTFEEWVAAHERALVRFALLVVGDQAGAEDAVQEALASVVDVAGGVQSAVVCHQPVDPDADGWARTLSAGEIEQLTELLIDASVQTVDCDTQPVADNRVLMTDGDGRTVQVVLPDPGCSGYRLDTTVFAESDDLQALVASWSEDPLDEEAVAWSQDPPASP